MATKSPKYTRRHYVDIARLVSKFPPKERKEETEKYCRLFAADNPRFDRAKFMKACGVK